MSLSGNTDKINALIAAIDALPSAGGSGTTVQRKSGTFTTNSSGDATVNCGWQPDIVYVRGETETSDGQTLLYSTCMNFVEETRTGTKETIMWAGAGVIDILWTRSSTGFSVGCGLWDWSWEVTAHANKTFDYVAVKYT